MSQQEINRLEDMIAQVTEESNAGIKKERDQGTERLETLKAERADLEGRIASEFAATAARLKGEFTQNTSKLDGLNDYKSILAVVDRIGEHSRSASNLLKQQEKEANARRIRAQKEVANVEKQMGNAIREATRRRDDRTKDLRKQIAVLKKKS